MTSRTALEVRIEGRSLCQEIEGGPGRCWLGSVGGKRLGKACLKDRWSGGDRLLKEASVGPDKRGRIQRGVALGQVLARYVRQILVADSIPYFVVRRGREEGREGGDCIIGEGRCHLYCINSIMCERIS